MRPQFLHQKMSFLVGWLSILSGFFIFNVSSVRAQIADVYLGAAATYTVFLNKGDIKIDKSLIVPQITGGISIYLNSAQRLKINGEIAFAGRYFNTNLSNSTFEFRTLGFRFNTLVSYPISEKLELEGGMGIYLYKMVLLEDDTFKRLGGQSNIIDINVIAGTKYQLNNWLDAGVRASIGLIPMTKVYTVEKYGEMGRKKHLLNALTPEIYLRLKIYNRNR